MKSFEIDVIVEIPNGSRYKYEVDKKTGQLIVDRPLPAPIPYNYGYVPNTLHGDGDPLDVCIIGVHPIAPLAKVKVILLGALICEDNGESDDKLIVHVVGEDEIALMQSFLIAHVTNYLSCYKEGFVVKGFVGPEEAQEILMKDIQSFQVSE